MCDLSNLSIDLQALKEGQTTLHFTLDNDYFKNASLHDVLGGTVHTEVIIDRHKRLFDLKLHAKGTLRIPCDICLEEMEHAVDYDDLFVIELGNGTPDGDTIVIDEQNPMLDFAALINDSLDLQLPIRHVHEEGQCNAEMIARLNAQNQSSTETIDPRWKDLEKLRNDI